MPSPSRLRARLKTCNPEEQRAKSKEKSSAALVGVFLPYPTLLGHVCLLLYFWEQVRAQALRIVQDWGIAFQTDMSLAYAETYGR